jgi:hypothetical protein
MSYKKNIETIILEETQNLLLERRLYSLIEQEAAKLGVSLTEEQKKSILQRLKKSAKKYAGPLAMGAAIAGGSAALHGLQSDYESDLRAQASQNAAAAEEYQDSFEGVAKTLKKQLNNTAAYLWSMSPDPQDVTMLPITGAGAGVLPPDWSVMKKVHDDFMSGAGPTFTPDGAIGASGDPRQNRLNFAKDFGSTQVKGYGGAKGLRGTIYIDFDDLPENYALPLSGKSPSEQYVQLWDKYVGY